MDLTTSLQARLSRRFRKLPFKICTVREPLVHQRRIDLLLIGTSIVLAQ